MVFEKKVIIGSIVSFIATTVGVIAVFFPDLLNLQKEKIQEYSTSISNKKEVQDFINFLDNMSKENKIFKLDVVLCFQDNKYKNYKGNIDNFLIGSEEPTNTNNKADVHLQNIVPISELSLEDRKWCFEEISENNYRSDMCGGKDYYFETEPFVSSELIGDWSRTSYTGQNYCDNSKFRYIGLALTGYFINSKSRPYKQTIENTFETISAKQLKLKEY